MIAAAMLILPMGVDAQTNWLRDEILERNPLREGANFNVAANNGNRATQEGLFTTTDEFGTAHFFRGTHELNNNVIFAGHQWKILRIDGNGNIRLIYNGECLGNNCEINGNDAGMDATIGLKSFSIGAHCDASLYADNSSCGFYNRFSDTDLYLSIYNWFVDNITDGSRQKVINNTSFCYDRSMPTRELPSPEGHWQWWQMPQNPAHWNHALYAASARLGIINDVQPTLNCHREEDEFNLPIGLITADELAMAGFRRNIINTDMFLSNGITAIYDDGWYTGSYGIYWTMTPSAIHPTGGPQVFVFNTTEEEGDSWHVEANIRHKSAALRPVLSLHGDVTVIGDGSSENPFVVIGMEERPEEPGNGNENENNNNSDNDGTDSGETTTNNPQTSVSGMLAYGTLALSSVAGIATLNRKKKRN